MVIKIDKQPIPITEIEQSAFCQTDGELASKTLEQEFDSGVRWQKLPVSYMRTSPEELERKISSAKKKLGDKWSRRKQNKSNISINFLFI